MACTTSDRCRNERWQKKWIFRGAMYQSTANVNEARKALWSKTFRAFGHVKGSAVIIVSSEEFYDKRPFIILKPQLIKREITY